MTAVLAAVFELIYNVTNARAYWESVSEYGLSEHSDDIGNIDYINRLDLTTPTYHHYRTVAVPQQTFSYNSPYIPGAGRRLNTESSEIKPSSVKNKGNYRDSLNYLLGLPPNSILF